MDAKNRLELKMGRGDKKNIVLCGKDTTSFAIKSYGYGAAQTP
ncbi:hypothetical protein HanIR_Chr11g0505451 [Helianthus annuus]|nr:hypothetical protein HanIR_Chr11g0505451 [Helianthus annuus]